MDDAPHTGPDRVPPGQYVTDKWPVLTYGRTPEITPEKWTLKISGLVAAERTLSWKEFQALPRVRITADFHCVTRFSTLDNGWEGIATSEVLKQVRVDPEASHVMLHCYGGYTTNLPLEDFLSGPVRLVVPHLYAWKSAKWVSGVELLSEDRRGFWEENGYHTYGDPWKEERFSSQETREAYQVRRRAKELGIVPED
jgi:DMSO/TMAO reductase YedYZ molybdopterin-dependent catalytic subunit